MTDAPEDLRPDQEDPRLAQLKKDVGNRLVEARNIARMTQAQAQKALKVGQNAISLWERGVYLPRIENLMDLAQLYQCSVDWILGITQLPQITGSGGIIDLDREATILAAESLSDLEAIVEESQEIVLFGYRVPEKFRVVDDEEWNMRRSTLLNSLERLRNDQGKRASRGKGKKPKR